VWSGKPLRSCSDVELCDLLAQSAGCRDLTAAEEYTLGRIEEELERRDALRAERFGSGQAAAAGVLVEEQR
jgi:hypothetical protein